MSEEGIVRVEQEIEVLFQQEETESEDPPWEEWSSLLCYIEESRLTEKQRLYEEGLYKPPSSEICAKYIPMSDSSVFRHPYYAYPSVHDPGIEEALLEPPPRITYTDDGQEYYLDLCKEMDEAYSRIFHRQLLEPHMNMSYYGISSFGWRPMALALMKNRIVYSIDFTSNFINQDGCYHFGNLLLVNNTITELNFSGCRMGPEGIRRLVVNFPKNKSLRKIDLSRNQLGDQGMIHLALAIFKGSSISDINLSYNGLTVKSAIYLADAIEFVNKITHLDLSWNGLLIPKPVEILISRFVESDNLLEINLSWNSLSNRFAKAISNLLLCPNIQVINLSNNNLTGEVITLIGQRLADAKKLNVLDLSNNPITLLEAKRLVRYMRLRRIKLKSLLMDNVKVDEAFVKFKDRILSMKSKIDCVITHGYVDRNIVVKLVDMRDIVLRRAQIVCRKPKKKRVNVGMMLLKLNKNRSGMPLFNNELHRSLKELGAFQLSKDLVMELALAFPGPRVDNERTCNVAAMADYVLRMWPDTKLPPTPPPPPPPPEPIRGKGKKADLKGKKET